MTKAKVVWIGVMVVLSASLGFRFKDQLFTSADTSTTDSSGTVSTKPLAPEWVMVYDSLHLESLGLSQKAFKYAWQGFQLMKLQNPVVAIADLSQSSCKKRLYVINLLEKRLLVNTYVAHGRNSGEEFARRFSNKNSSFQSSLGFYRTLDPYQGKHGLSLKLEGIEKGINDKAYERAIVMHGADYVSEKFIKNTGRLGRSLGCPAVSLDENEKLIRILGRGAGLFLYSPDTHYLNSSPILAGLTQ
jgi:hypothetical protein